MFERIENSKTSYWHVSITIFAAILIRIIIEYSLEAQKRVEEPASLFLFFAYFATVMAGVLLFVWLFSGKDLLKASRVVAFFSPLLWIPPFVDLAASGGKGYVLSYVFNSSASFWDALLNFYPQGMGGSLGLQLEVGATALVAAAYVFWASRSWLKTILCGAAVYVFILFGAFFPGYLMQFFGHPFQDIYLYRETVSSYALFLTLSALLFLHSHKCWPHIAKRFRVERSMHYAAWALFGAFVGLEGWQHPLPGALLPLAALLLSVVFAFEASVWVNDVFDRSLDRHGKKGKIVKEAREHENTAIFVLIALSLLNGLAAGYAAVVLVAFAFALSFVYSAPPLRLRNHFVTASLVLAACAVAMLLAGYGLGALQPEKTPGAVPISYVLMAFCLVFLASSFKDFKDAEADRKEGVFTLPSWLGVAKAKPVVALLTVIGVACVVLLSSFPAWLGGLLAGSVAWAILRVKEAARMELLVFFMEYLFMAAVALWVTGFWNA